MGLQRRMCKQCGERPQARNGCDGWSRQKYAALCAKCRQEKQEASFQKRYGNAAETLPQGESKV
jgi:hypothetical protein